MIQEHYNANGTNFTLPNKALIIWRYLPFGFSMTSGAGQVVAPAITLITNEDCTKQGSIDLVTYLRDKAVTEQESWNQTQLNAIADAKALYIVYSDFENMQLNFSNETLSIEEIQAQFPESQIFLRQLPARQESFDIWLNKCYVLMLSLVNQLLNWMLQ